jgi:hypothetical protein
MGKTSSHLGAGRKRRSPTKRSTAAGSNDSNAERGNPGLVIRDSFTMPEADYELIGALKKRCLGLGIAIKKSELLRAGLATLQRLSDDSLAQIAATIERVTTGRPPGRNKKAKANRTMGSKQ